MLVEKNIDNFQNLNWLLDFMRYHKGFICGGCFKNIFNHEKVKDLDIFFKSMRDWEDAVAYFDTKTVGYRFDDKGEEEYQFYYENDNVKAYKHLKTGVVIELCCKIFGTAKEIIDSFDFTITKFALYKDEVEDEDWVAHIETKILCDDLFFEHLQQKRLVIDNKIPYPMSTFERMLRYAKYGYFPCRETKMKLIGAIRELDERQVELSENLYNGVD